MQLLFTGTPLCHILQRYHQLQSSGAFVNKFSPGLHHMDKKDIAYQNASS